MLNCTRQLIHESAWICSRGPKSSEYYIFYYICLGQILQIEKYEPGKLGAWTAEFWEVRCANGPTLQAFMSMNPSWFSKFSMIDGSIMYNTFKELKEIDAMLKTTKYN